MWQLRSSSSRGADGAERQERTSFREGESRSICPNIGLFRGAANPADRRLDRSQSAVLCVAIDDDP